MYESNKICALVFPPLTRVKCLALPPPLGTEGCCYVPLRMGDLSYLIPSSHGKYSSPHHPAILA